MVKNAMRLTVAAIALLAIGCTTPEVCRQAVDDARVLAVQIAAGSECLDMTRARHCAFFSTGWNMGQYLQALKRVRRAGWEKYADTTGDEGVVDRPVTYYHLLGKNTVDDRVYGTLLKRGDLVRGALEGLRALSTVPN